MHYFYFIVLPCTHIPQNTHDFSPFQTLNSPVFYEKYQLLHTKKLKNKNKIRNSDEVDRM